MIKRMMRKVLFSIMVMSLTAQLLGCGTLGRSASTEQTYRGVDRDKTQISNAYLWMISLGVWPLFHIISLPVDAVIDTALLPVDLARNPSPYEDHTQASIIIPIFAVNMTDTPDFSYTIQNKRSGDILSKGVASKIPQTGNQSSKLDIVSVLTRSNPSPRIDSIEIKWQTTQSAPLGNNPSGAITLLETLTPKDNLRGARSVIALFMPCNKVVLINSDSFYYNADFIMKKSIQESYKKLTNMAKNSQCALSSQFNTAIEHSWK